MESLIFGLLVAIALLAVAVVYLGLKVLCLQPLATRDGLTSVFDRREIERLLGEAVKRAFRAGHPVSLIILDVDHFKEINDQRGHITGDEVLRRVAKKLQDTLEIGDLIGRWGGDEFVIILAGTPLRNARAIAERLRSKIASQDHSLDGAATTITLGVACRSKGDTMGLFDAADQALLKAKRAGGNRVEVG